MKAVAFCRGDGSVGISGADGSVDLGIDVADDEREVVREEVASFFGGLWGEKATVIFEDEEFDDFGRLQRKAVAKEV